MLDKGKLKEAAERLSFLLLEKFKNELVEQGHVLDGNLRDSLELKYKERISGFSLEFVGLSYGVRLNDGVPSGDIPKMGSARYNDLLADMAKYVSKRIGIGDHYGIAKRIINVWSIEGMPTTKSYRFSKNGRRLGWIDWVLKNQKEQIDKIVEEILLFGAVNLIEKELLELNKY